VALASGVEMLIEVPVTVMGVAAEVGIEGATVTARSHARTAITNIEIKNSIFFMNYFPFGLHHIRVRTEVPPSSGEFWFGRVDRFG
jgi:hypothetical protein